LLAVVASCAVLATLAPAAPHVEADPSQMYPVQPGSGAWFVCAASYTGPEARDQANQLVYWVRAHQNTPAYVFSRSDEERKRLNEEYAARGTKKSVRVEDQYAVLIGGYDTDATAAKARDVIRKWPMPQIKRDGDLSPGVNLTVEYKKEATGLVETRRDMQPVNPFQTALVIRNPVAPKPTSTAPKVDAFMKRLNANEEYSLLNNPKSWTLAVKQYSGGGSMVGSAGPDPSQTKGATLMEKWFGKSQGENLVHAGGQAHEVARVLRKLGFQAWVLHTPYSSVVTVGGFDAIDDKEMEPLRSRLAQLTREVIANSQTRTDPLGLFPNAPPMEVPH
jgi:hypothetical protein